MRFGVKSHRDENCRVGAIVKVFSVTLAVTVRWVNLKITISCQTLFLVFFFFNRIKRITFTKINGKSVKLAIWAVSLIFCMISHCLWYIYIRLRSFHFLRHNLTTFTFFHPTLELKSWVWILRSCHLCWYPLLMAFICCHSKLGSFSLVWIVFDADQLKSEKKNRGAPPSYFE